MPKSRDFLIEPDGWHRELIDREPDHGQYANLSDAIMTPDYAEVLRLHRKYHESDAEPLWKVFVRVGQRLEKAAPERCKTCFRTDLEYCRLVDAVCTDPFHTREA
jgi:hypothetical protein